MDREQKSIFQQNMALLGIILIEPNEITIITQLTYFTYINECVLLKLEK